jgi:hypothetical protein
MGLVFGHFLLLDFFGIQPPDGNLDAGLLTVFFYAFLYGFVYYYHKNVKDHISG